MWKLNTTLTIKVTAVCLTHSEVGWQLSDYWVWGLYSAMHVAETYIFFSDYCSQCLKQVWPELLQIQRSFPLGSCLFSPLFNLNSLDQWLIEVIRLYFIIQGVLHSQSDKCCCNLYFLATDVDLADLGLLIPRTLFYFFEPKNAFKCRFKSVSIES